MRLTAFVSSHEKISPFYLIEIYAMSVKKIEMQEIRNDSVSFSLFGSGICKTVHYKAKKQKVLNIIRIPIFSKILFKRIFTPLYI